MQKLYETYRNMEDIGIVGQFSADGKVLLPIGHTLIKAHITVTIDAEGNLIRAEAVKDRGETIAPCTEKSDSRSGKRPVPHPLVDKLQYLAGDFERYTGEDVAWAYEQYLNELHAWSTSHYAHPKVQAILAYIEKRRLVEDLVAQRVLFLDSNGKVLDKWNGAKEAAPELFKIPNCTPSKAAVRFRVLGLPGDDRVWIDPFVRQSFQSYLPLQQQMAKEKKDKKKKQGQPQKQPEKRLCYVTGEMVPYIEKHPKKIVGIHGNAKLISANDNGGFTYRGRFGTPAEALSIGYSVSLKAHYALRWLVETRGIRCGTGTIVAFGTKNEPIPSPIADTDELIPMEIPTDSDLLLEADIRTEGNYARRLKQALYGYKYDHLDKHADVVVMVLDAATDGRLSITFYRELKRGEYLECIYKWHTTCIWKHNYKIKDKKTYSFDGMPSSEDITLAAYGMNASKETKRATAERLLPCIFNGASIPPHLVGAVTHRAARPMTMERWEWNKTLSIACALYNKQHQKEGFGLALDETRKDRSYLFGRLLAVADQLESRALFESGEKRETTAMRLMSAFAQRPVKTWTVIAGRLRPYQKKLGGISRYYEDLISHIMDMFNPEDYDPTKDRPLDGLYLLGYHNQRQVFLDTIQKAKEKKNAELVNTLSIATESEEE